jgi:hypothetical protein
MEKIILKKEEYSKVRLGGENRVDGEVDRRVG